MRALAIATLLALTALPVFATPALAALWMRLARRPVI